MCISYNLSNEVSINRLERPMRPISLSVDRCREGVISIGLGRDLMQVPSSANSRRRIDTGIVSIVTSEAEGVATAASRIRAAGRVSIHTTVYCSRELCLLSHRHYGLMQVRRAFELVV